MFFISKPETFQSLQKTTIYLLDIDNCIEQLQILG